MAEDAPHERGTAARVGIAALNLLAPGLGLLRVGCWRTAIAFLLTPYVVTGAGFVALRWSPALSPSIWLALVTSALAGMITLYIVSILISWRESRLRTPIRPWSRWYALGAVVIANMIGADVFLLVRDHSYKSYHIVAESMQPALVIADHLIVDQRGRDPVGIGDVVIVAVGDTDYVQRVVAKGGDRVELRAGVPIVNGRAARQMEIGRTRIDELGTTLDARVVREQLPGNTRSHRVFDLGYSLGDDFPATTVPAGHYFLLGDNRDRAADSRFEARDNGVGMASADRIRGRALFKIRPVKAFGTRLDVSS